MWPLKKKENEDKIDGLINELFSGGRNEINRQVKELKEEMGYDPEYFRFSTDDIEDALIYMTALFAVSTNKSSDAIVGSTIRRTHNKMNIHILRLIYKYVARQRFIQISGSNNDVLFEAFLQSIGNIKDGCTTDVIPGSYGEYGLCATNPIPVRGIVANEVYLNQIELENGDPIQWCRLGSTIANNINGCIDMYKITTLAGDNVCTLYISPYQNTISGIAPKGFRIKSEQ